MSGRVIAHNSFLNLLGQGIPLLVALFAIPVLIEALGPDRFGVLSLVWMTIGYFSLFDFGLGRALTKLIAERLGTEREGSVLSLTWTGLLLMLFLGVGGALIAALLSPLLVGRVLNVPHSLQGETLRTFYLLSLSLPVVITTAGLRGVLEAHHRFGMVNAIRIPMGIFSFAGPLLVLPFSSGLDVIAVVLVAGRVAAWLAHWTLCSRVVPDLGRKVKFRRDMVRPLLGFGGWMTVSNVVGPIMVYMDRFLIGAVLSMAAVAYYTTPYEVVTKLWLIPGAMLGVMFPAFSKLYEQQPSRAASLFRQAVIAIFVIVFPLTLLIVTLGGEVLSLWVGAEFARKSETVLQWLAVGVFLNSLALVPFTLIQGAGRADVTAKLHLFELPVYLVALWWLTVAYGIEGAAIAWVLRVAADALFLFSATHRFFLAGGNALGRGILPCFAAGILLLVVAAFLSGLATKSLFLGFAFLAGAPAMWFFLLGPSERSALVALGVTAHHKMRERMR